MTNQIESNQKRIVETEYTNSVFSPIGLTKLTQIDFPISIKGYINTWSISEVIREMVSNAIDACKDLGVFVHYDRRNNIVCIEDNGDGFTVKNLLLGVSEKSKKDSIGQFGEGMKLALLVCVRDNIQSIIFTKDLVIVPSVFQIEMVDCLRLTVYQNTKTITGTQVFLHFNTDEILKYLENFLIFYPKTEIYYHESLNTEILDCDNTVYLRGVKIVTNVDSIFSYNFKSARINRDRNVLSLDEVKGEIEQVLYNNYNSDVIDGLIKNKDSSKIETTISLSFSIDFVLAFQREFGEKAVLLTNESNYEEMTYRKYRPIKMPERWVWGLFVKGIKRDIDILEKDKEKAIAQKKYHITTLKITPQQRKNLSIAIKLCRKGVINYFKRGIDLEELKQMIRLVEKSEDENVMGYHLGRLICLTFKSLDSLQSALDSLAHELCHEYSGLDDGAKFAVCLSNFLVSIICEMKGLENDE